MPFKAPMKRGEKRKIMLEFRGERQGTALKKLGKAVRALAKAHKLKLVKRKRG